MTTEPLILCEKVGRRFGIGAAATIALCNVDCRVLPGERIALMGPSGSGKSTLLHLMAGIDRPTEGTVSWPAIGLADALRPGPVALVFQGPSLLPPLTVAENVALPLLLGGERDANAHRRSLDALERLGLRDLADKLPEELSGGQAQRVAITRGLVGDPRVILADEPTSQVDRENARRVVDVLLEAAEAARAALIVATHDALVADRLDQRWVVADGRLSTSLEVATC
jgi:ABC-type lipoprotein export system ATPase subunit